MHHSLAAVYAQALAATMTVGMMLAQLHHSLYENEPQDHPFPENDNLQIKSKLNFKANETLFLLLLINFILISENGTFAINKSKANNTKGI